MTKLVRICALLLVFVSMVSFAQAQKFGYVNSQALLAEMSDVKQARSELETLEKQLRAKGQGMLTSLQTKYQEAQKKVEQGILSPKEQEEEATKLREEESKIAQFEQEMVQKIQQKEATLLQPILDKVNTAIKEVAEENGYTFIFDSSTQVLLYADDSTDISTLIRTKLGI